MTFWKWESLSCVNSKLLQITNSGPLYSPVRDFTLARDDKLSLILETTVVGNVQDGGAPDYPAGTVRLNTEELRFAGRDGMTGMTAVARGVIPFGEHRTWNLDGIQQITEKSKLYSLTVEVRTDAKPAYTIDWLDNLDKSSGVWTGSFFEDEVKTHETTVWGRGTEAIKLSIDAVTEHSVSKSALEMVIDGTRLFLCASAQNDKGGIKRPGYILYVGKPEDGHRKRIRDVLSFCLGNYFIYLGSSILSDGPDLLEFHAVSPPSIGRILEINVQPPAPLGEQYEQQIDERALVRMTNALYAHYDELRFGSLSWAYWHAVCAPVHMAAVHFGAAIEGVRDAYVKSHPSAIPSKLISDEGKWKSLKDALLSAVGESGVESSAATILNNKIKSNLNQTPATVTTDKMLAAIGITLGPLETAAWKRRHTAAHGSELAPEEFVAVIRDTKLLKIMLHRIVLRISGASDTYYDDYSIGHATRKVTDPVPSPSPASVARL